MANRYFTMGAVFIADDTTTTDKAGRQTTDQTITITGGAGNFTIYMTRGMAGTVTSGTAAITGSVVTLSAGLNTLEADGNGDCTLDVTIGSAANWNHVQSWSAASGGTGGASVPTSSDNVYFDANSFTAGSQTLTVDAAASCLDKAWTGATNTPTFAGTLGLFIYGSLIYIAAMVKSFTGIMNFSSTGAKTVTWGGTIASSLVQFIGTNGSWEFQDELNVGAGGIRIRQDVDTNGQTITCGTFDRSGVILAFTLTLGASVINCTSWGFGNTTSLTVAANTATINISGTGALAGGDADWNGADFNLNGTAHTVSGSFTCATLATPAATTQALTFTAGNTITCTTDTLSGDATHAHTIVSGTAGTLANIVATTATEAYVTYTDILRSFAGVVTSDCDGAGGGTFVGGDGSYTLMTLQGAGSYALIVTGDNTFGKVIIDRTEEAKTLTGTAASTQTIRRLQLLGNNTNVVTLDSSGAAWTIQGNTGYFEGDYMSLTNVAATEKYLYYAGDNSTDGTGNTNWTFTRKVRPFRTPGRR